MPAASHGDGSAAAEPCVRREAAGGYSRSSPARIASAASARCDSSTISGGESATPRSSGRTSTPAARAPAATLATAPGSAASASSESATAPSRPSAGAHLADGVVVGERSERVAQRLLQLPAAADQVLGLVGVEHRERRRGARRVAGVGRAVAQHRAARAGEERRGDRAVDDHAAERQVAARHALGERDHVGPHLGPALDPEPRAEPAEGADHRVDDEQDPVLGAQVGDALDVALRRAGTRRRRRSPARRRRPRRARARRAGSPARARAASRRRPPRSAGRAGPSWRCSPRSRRSTCRSRACRGSRSCG